jgi:hypothetical protein
VFDNPRYRESAPVPGSGQSVEALDFQAFLADADPSGLYQDVAFDWNANDLIATNTMFPMDAVDPDVSLDDFPPFHNLS